MAVVSEPANLMFEACQECITAMKVGMLSYMPLRAFP